MYKLVEQLAEQLAKKYFLDKDALLNKSSNIMYINLGNGLVEVDKKTHLSKCISTEKEKITAFTAIQSLLYCIH